MNTTLSRYSTALLPLAVLVLGVLDAAQRAGTSLVGWQTITQLVLLVVTTGAAFWLPLVPGKWSGALKTGAAVVGAIVSALVAVVPDGHFTQGTWILFLTAAIKAVAVQVGVSIRSDAATIIDAGSTSDPGVPVITSATVPADAAYELHPTPVDAVGSAEAEQSGTTSSAPETADDAPKHLATS